MNFFGGTQINCFELNLDTIEILVETNMCMIFGSLFIITIALLV